MDTGALADWLGCSEVTVTGSPTGGGWSNETVLITADDARLVVRLAPRGRSMFPTYDLGHQVRAMRYARELGVAVPAVVGDDTAGAVLGRPMFVMELIAGRVPADDDPPFTRAGFLHDASADQQRCFHDSAIDAIAGIHIRGKPPFDATGPQPADHLAACRRLAEWCEHMPDIVFAAHDELAVTTPVSEAERCGLLWGDARPANMVVGDRFEVVGLLDWELSAWGPGELDVAWFCEMNRMRADGMGIPRLPGFPDDDDTWQRWQGRVGRPADHRVWFERFSAFRVSAFMQLYLASLVHRGELASDHRLLTDNPGTRRLQELMG